MSNKNILSDVIAITVGNQDIVMAEGQAFYETKHGFELWVIDPHTKVKGWRRSTVDFLHACEETVGFSGNKKVTLTVQPRQIGWSFQDVVHEYIPEEGRVRIARLQATAEDFKSTGVWAQFYQANEKVVWELALDHSIRYTHHPAYMLTWLNRKYGATITADSFRACMVMAAAEEVCHRWVQANVPQPTADEKEAARRSSEREIFPHLEDEVWSEREEPEDGDRQAVAICDRCGDEVLAQETSDGLEGSGFDTVCFECNAHLIAQTEKE